MPHPPFQIPTAALAVVLATGVAAALPAAAVPRVSVPRSPLLWATINTCDTSKHPDTVGVRGSMPGSGRAEEQMFMRLRLEYLTAPGGPWRLLGPGGGDSGWIKVGSGKYRARQSGRNFTVVPPATGAYRLRGVVRFEWRRGTKVVARALRHTVAGHAPTAGADPAGFSAASCDVKRP